MFINTFSIFNFKEKLSRRGVQRGVYRIFRIWFRFAKSRSVHREIDRWSSEDSGNKRVNTINFFVRFVALSSDRHLQSFDVTRTTHATVDWRVLNTRYEYIARIADQSDCFARKRKNSARKPPQPVSRTQYNITYVYIYIFFCRCF